MPDAKVTELEHWKLKAKAQELISLGLEIELTKKTLQELEAARPRLESEKRGIIQEIGQRVGAKGDLSAWKLRLAPEPKESTISWEEGE